LALADYRLAREGNPRYSTAWLGEAQAAMELKDNSSALSAINEYLKLKPQSEKALEMKKTLTGG
jgi:predicted Zn-dependent protease